MGGYILIGKNTPSVEKEVVKIGFISAQTGIGASIGQEELKGAELAVEGVNKNGGVLSKIVTLIIEDVSLDKLKNAGSATLKLINVDKVVAIVGPQWDEPVSAILPIINKAHMPTISQNVTRDVKSAQTSDYFFSVFPDHQVSINTLLKLAQQKGWKKIAIIRPLNAGFWEFTRNLFIASAPKYGIAIIGDENVGNPLTTDFRTVIIKIKAKNPDAVFVVLADPGECVFLKQAKELGLHQPILSTESAGNAASLGQCPDLLENLYFSTPTHGAAYAPFAERFKEKFGNEPQFPSAVMAYDAVRIVLHAFEKTGGKSGKALRDAIAGIRDYAGNSLSNITFNEQGFVITPENAFEIQTIRKGVFIKQQSNSIMLY